jgi:hypothetical protein
MSFDDIRRQATTDLERFFAPNHFDFRGPTPQAYQEIVGPLLQRAVGLTLREAAAAKLLSCWVHSELATRKIYAGMVGDVDSPAQTMTRDQAIQIGALEYLTKKAAHRYAIRVGDATLLEDWPKPVWNPKLFDNVAPTIPSKEKPASVLFHAELSGREFSSHLLKVADLLNWAKSKGKIIKTNPSLDRYEFVQAEAFLCAIEREVSNTVTAEQALEIVSNDNELNTHRAAGDPQMSRWLLSADAHKQWRELLETAVTTGELTLLRFNSKLPVSRPTETGTVDFDKEKQKPAQPKAEPAAVDEAEPATNYDEWKKKAQILARKIIKRHKEKDLYPNQMAIADQIANEFRKAEPQVVGAGGKPLTGAYIKRHALKGISSEQGKQLSTATRRGK